MLTLYHNDMSSCAQKVRFTLAEKGLDWKGVELNLRARDQLNPEFLAINPKGLVPALVDDVNVFVESNVIIEYLNDAYPDPALLPDDPVVRARCRWWMKRLDDGLHLETIALSFAIAFRHQYLALSKEELAEHLAATPDLERRERKRVTIEHGMASPAAIDAVNFHDRVLDKIEGRLDGRSWLAGEAYSLAEVNLTPYIVRLDHLQLAWMWDKRPLVASWYERIVARASAGMNAPLSKPGGSCFTSPAWITPSSPTSGAIRSAHHPSPAPMSATTSPSRRSSSPSTYSTRSRTPSLCRL